jgi:hypothetical protein
MSKDLNIVFIYRKDVVADNTWQNPTTLPQIGHRVYLGKAGAYWWYEVDRIEWQTAHDVLIYLINRKSS